MKKIVMDKSWIQAVSAEELLEFSKQYMLLVPDILTEEATKVENDEKREADRKKLWTKLSKIKDSIQLTHNLAYYLNYEKDNGKCCTPHIDERGTKALQGYLRENNFKLNSKQKNVSNSANEEHEKRVGPYMETVKTVLGLLDGLLQDYPECRGKINADMQSVLTSEACLTCFGNKNLVVAFHELVTKDSKRKWPQDIDENWAFFKRWQINLSCITDSRLRGETNHNKIANHLRDMEYGILGAIFDGLATKDKRLQLYFNALYPKKRFTLQNNI